MGMVDGWSEMSLKKKMKKRDEIYGKREKIEWKGMILGENEWKWRRNEGRLKVLAMEGLEREKEVERECHEVEDEMWRSWVGTTVKNLDRRL